MFALIDPNSDVVDVQASRFEAPPQLTWVEIPAGITVQFRFKYANGQFTDPNAPDLATAKLQQVQVLSRACALQIKAGFTSSALSSAYTYASTEVDQRNITQSAQASKGGLLACQNAAGVWSREPHTQAQSQQALEDFVTARDGERTKLGALVTQITAATTIEAVQAIVWA